MPDLPVALADADPPAGADIIVTGQPLNRNPNEVYVECERGRVSGWTDVEITLVADGFPNSFNLSASAAGYIPAPGASCAILIGSDLVVTGYVDRQTIQYEAEAHNIRLSGRGKTQDLVDCSAEWSQNGGNIQGTALMVAKALALPYGIAVEMGSGVDPGEYAYGSSLNYGQAAAEIIQAFARNAGLLAYEDSRGRLILDRIGSGRAGGGIALGHNVESATIENSATERYSEIVCCSEAMNTLGELGGDDFYERVTDSGVSRHRLKYVVVEPVTPDPQKFLVKHARWEMARRIGESAAMRVTVSGWRDAKGALWRPNTQVDVNVAGNQAGSPLVIAQVTFRRDMQRGTTTDMTLVLPGTFAPEPVVLQPAALGDVPQAGAPAAGGGQ